jgi:hypothetical protein
MFRIAPVRVSAVALAAVAASLAALPARAQDGLAPQPLFVATGARAGARMGELVCAAGDTDGDGNGDVLVGTDSTLSVFSGANGQLLYTIYATHAGDFLDASALVLPDVDGDGHADLVVGAPHVVLNGQRDAGVIYLFSGANGQGLRAIAGPGPQLRGRFGASLALLGDVDGDGRPEVAVGAPGTVTAGRPESGSVSIVSPTRGRILAVWRGIDGEQAGTALAAVGDLDGDRQPDVAAGAPRAHPSDREEAGRVIYLSGVDAHQLRTLDGQQPGDHLGQALANAGDLDGGGAPDLIVGMPGRRAAATGGTGAILVVAPASGTPLLQIDGPAGSHSFGAVVSGGADFNGDGHPDFLAADPRADVEGRSGAGLVQLFSGLDVRLLLTAAGSAFDGLGSAVAFAGDLNGDGRADVILGAPFHDVLAVPDVGAALAFADVR